MKDLSPRLPPSTPGNILIFERRVIYSVISVTEKGRFPVRAPGTIVKMQIRQLHLLYVLRAANEEWFVCPHTKCSKAEVFKSFHRGRVATAVHFSPGGNKLGNNGLFCHFSSLRRRHYLSQELNYLSQMMESWLIVLKDQSVESITTVIMWLTGSKWCPDQKVILGPVNQNCSL